MFNIFTFRIYYIKYIFNIYTFRNINILFPPILKATPLRNLPSGYDAFYSLMSML